jgi:hypothetical protein
MFYQYQPTSSNIRALSFHCTHAHSRVQPSDVVHALLKEESPLSHSLPPIFSALQALDNYSRLRALLATLPPHLHYAIKASLLISDPYQDLRLKILDMLTSKDYDMDTIVDEVDAVPLSHLLHHECVFQLIEGMLIEPKKYRHELAFLFTQLSVHQLPQHLQKRATSSATLPLTLLPTYSGWYLCSEAEGRLSQAMHDQAILLVNGTILLKFNGKLSGLALKTVLLADGTQLLEGCWYAPIDHRDEIRDAFDRGESHLYVEGQWTLIRAWKEHIDDTLLQRAQTYAATLPEQLPQQIGNVSRQTYRYTRHERFPDE